MADDVCQVPLSRRDFLQSLPSTEARSAGARTRTPERARESTFLQESSPGHDGADN